MNEKEINDYLAGRLGIKPELVPYFIDLQRDRVILNPLLPDSVRRLGRAMGLKQGQRVLDLACGKAGVSLPLVFIYKVELLGVDIIPEFIRQAWSRAEASGLYLLCDFINDDAASFAEKTRKKWDAVLMLGASFIWNGLEGALKVLPGLVSAGGHLAVGEPYYKPGAQKRPDRPILDKEEITAIIQKTGRIVEIIDDGDEGWQSYVEPENKARKRIKKENPDQADLHQFLDDMAENLAWEVKNLGWAVWVLEISS